MVHTLFSPEVKWMLDENDAKGMKVFLESLHPATVAEALTGELEPAEVWRVLENTNIRHQAAIFEYIPIDTQVKLVEGVGQERMAALIKQMSHDDRVDLMRRLMPRVVESLMRLVDKADREDIALLVRQDENTAGGLMTTDYAWLPPNLTATEALDRLRLQAPESETIYYIFVLDEQHRLLGVVTLRDLILAPRHARISDLMEENAVSVRATDDRDKVAKQMAQYDLIAMPVVDEQNRMVGIITHDDVIDVVVQEATDDAHRMGAVAPLTDEYLTASIFEIWRKRAIWLSFLFIAELGTFTVLAHFQFQIEKVAVLALFLPLCISTGGNSGSQAATLITRAMALGEVKVSDWFQVFRHELIMGVLLAFTLGGIAFVRAWFTPDANRGDVLRLDLGLVIAISVFGICLWGSLIGSMLPMVFKRLGFDPGYASSPFVATFVDVTGIMIFFNVAQWFIPM
jgi:magnesium transporter